MANKKIEISAFGAPERMHLVTRDEGSPGPAEIRIKHHAIGVNFIDTYHRTGLYPISLPSGIGLEAAGVIVEIGANVTDVAVGDRVGYCSGPLGAYAESHIVKADRVIPLPDMVSYDLAAASMLKGLTVQYLIRRIHKAKAGETVLLHAAAGGVGLIATRWLTALGVTVIGTVGSESKAELAKKAGCAYVIRYDQENVAARVRDITDGRGVPVVFDGVGKATWEASLDSLQKLGLMVSFGNASGPVENINLSILASKGSLFVTRPTLFDYTSSKSDLRDSASDFFSALASRQVTVDIYARYPLAEAETAHRDLERRRTTGSLLLVP